MLPPSIPISQPVRSPKFGELPLPCTSHVHAKYDILVWFEICELGELAVLMGLKRFSLWCVVFLIRTSAAWMSCR